MIRKFYINMYQKGQLKNQLQCNIDKLVIFHKTENKSVQILEFDEDTLKCYFHSKMNYNACFLSILGVNENNPYTDRSKMREIFKDEKEGFKAIDINQISKQTEKAYFIKGLDSWIPKSQTEKDNQYLYIKNWLFFKNLF